jgi:hypothetical protein
MYIKNRVYLCMRLIPSILDKGSKEKLGRKKMPFKMLEPGNPDCARYRGRKCTLEQDKLSSGQSVSRRAFRINYKV